MSDKNFFSNLGPFLAKMSEIPSQEWLYLIQHLTIIRKDKGEHLFRQGEFSHMIGFVVSGLVHTYYVNPEGLKRTKFFAWDQQLISPWISILQQKPANFSAEALRTTYIIELDGRVLPEMMKRHRCWEKVSRICTEKVLAQREQREYEVLMMTNLERYHRFQEQFREIKDLIPQYLIASYLGITPVALSRLLSQT